MGGVTPHGIRYPDGASKAKNLGPELKNMAEDIDGHIDDRTSPAHYRPIVTGIAEEVVPEIVDDYVDDLPLVTSDQASDDESFEIRDANGTVVFAVDDIRGTPHLRGSYVPAIQVTESESFEVTDDNGYVLYRLSTGSGTGIIDWRETHLILSAGQSNEMGAKASPIAAGSNDPLPNLFVVPQRGAQSGQLVTAVDPLSHPVHVAEPNTRGHAVEVARRYAREHPDVRVIIVPYAVGDTGFRQPSSRPYTWAPAREGEAGVRNLYREAITETNRIAASYGASRVAMILWHQMEADASAETAAAQYESDLKALISGFRSSITGAANAPFILGQTTWEFRNVRQPGTYAELDAVLSSIPASVARTGFADAPGEGYCNDDLTHFTGEGQWLLADAYWRAYLGSLYNL